jgi:hypothetical protein
MMPCVPALVILMLSGMATRWCRLKSDVLIVLGCIALALLILIGGDCDEIFS